MDMSEIAFFNVVFVENVDKFTHYEVAPNGRKMEKYRDGQSFTVLCLTLVLKLSCRIETQLKSRHLAVDYLGVIDLANGDLLGFVWEPASRAADYPIFNNICVVVEKRYC